MRKQLYNHCLLNNKSLFIWTMWFKMYTRRKFVSWRVILCKGKFEFRFKWISKDGFWYRNVFLFVRFKYFHYMTIHLALTHGIF